MNAQYKSDLTLTHAGRTVFVEISPCSWMYKGYGLQVKLSLTENAPNAESVFVSDKSIACLGRTPADLANAETLARRHLEEKGVADIERAIEDFKKACAEWDKDQEAEEKREAKRLARRIAQMKAKGFTHRTLACIHPEAGDDYTVEMFTVGAPTKAQLARALKASVVKTDYKTVEL